MIEYENGTLRVSAGYSLKIPGAAQYSAEDAHASLSVEAQIDEGVTKLSDVMEQAKLLYATLAQSAKVAVFAQLDVEYDTTSTGLLRPIVKDRGGAAPAPSRPSSNGAAPQTFSQPKADVSSQPTVTIDGQQFYDLRGLKADGTYKPGAADFRSTEKVNGRYEQLWLKDRNGQQNVETIQKLERNNISTFTAADAQPF